MLTFPRARLVKPGDPVSAGDIASLNRRINAILLSGLGGIGWRILVWFLNSVRQVRLPDSSGLVFPTQGEAIEYYLHVDPKKAQWPDNGPGDPEGTNPNCFMVTVVYGNDEAGIDEESVRDTDPVKGMPVDFGGVLPTNAIERWVLHKLQVGYKDMDTGIYGCPAWTAARSHFWIRQSLYSAQGNSWGGFMPTPMVLGDCGDGTTELPPTLNFQYKFTNYITGQVVTYPGSCPGNPDNVAGAPFSFPGGWVVVTQGGRVDFYPDDQWTEGPYQGGNRLRRTFGAHLERVFNYFSAQFRGQRSSDGSPDQISAQDNGDDDWNSDAFDGRRFLTTQYMLAPQRGKSYGAKGVAIYQKWGVPIMGPLYVRQGTYLNRVGGGYDYAIAKGCVGASWVVCGHNLGSHLAVDAFVGGAAVSSIEVDPDENSIGSAIAIFDPPLAAGAKVSFRVRDMAQFKTGKSPVGKAAELFVELYEPAAYKPRGEDLFHVLRCSSCLEDSSGGTDGFGMDEDAAAQLGDVYFSEGLVLNLRGASAPGYDATEINTNALWESWRQMARDCVRAIPGHLVTGYSVENGKSCIWIKRKYLDQDIWSGVTPIVHTAAPGQWTREWMLGIDAKVYTAGWTSTYRPELYGYYYLVGNRCLSFNPVPNFMPASAKWQFAYGQDQWAPAEAPPGYEFAHVEGVDMNKILCDDTDTACIDFKRAMYRSCALYRPDIAIDKIEDVVEEGEPRVKVTLSGRLQHEDTADASISHDVGTWDVAAIRARIVSYGRTDEGTLLEWCIKRATGKVCVQAPGDLYSTSTFNTDNDGAGGACIPMIRLVALASMPYLDGNDDQDPSDTPLRHDALRRAEMYLRIASEAAVNKQITAQTACDSGERATLDFTYQDLMLQTTGQPFALSLPTRPTDWLDPQAVRADKLKGHGPIATLDVSSEVVNALVEGWMGINSFRVMAPYKFQTLELTGTATAVVSATVDCTSQLPCAGTGGVPVVTTTAPDPNASTVVGDWADASVASSSVSAALVADVVDVGTNNQQYRCVGSNWTLEASRSDNRYRWVFTDPDFVMALQPAWADMLQTYGTLVCSQVTTVTTTTISAQPGAGGATLCDGTNYMRDAAGRYLVVADTTKTTTLCLIPATGGLLHAPALGAAAYSTGMAPNGSGGISVANSVGALVNVTLTPVGADAIVLVIPDGPEDAPT